MKHISTGSQTHVQIKHVRHDNGARTADDCVACHVRAAYNMLARSIEILWDLALSKRHTCNAAGRCGNTRLSMAGNEPPQVGDCECFLTQQMAHTILGFHGDLEVMLDTADRLARMVDNRGGPPENKVRISPGGSGR